MKFLLEPFGNGGEGLDNIIVPSADGNGEVIIGRRELLNSYKGINNLNYVSRKHVKLFVREDNLFLQSLLDHDRRTVFVNNKLIENKVDVKLFDNDEISLLGQFQFYNFRVKSMCENEDIAPVSTIHSDSPEPKRQKLGDSPDQKFAISNANHAESPSMANLFLDLTTSPAAISLHNDKVSRNDHLTHSLPTFSHNSTSPSPMIITVDSDSSLDPIHHIRNGVRENSRPFHFDGDDVEIISFPSSSPSKISHNDNNSSSKPHSHQINIAKESASDDQQQVNLDGGKKEEPMKPDKERTISANMLQLVECGVCFEPMACTHTINPCGHNFCYLCIRDWRKKSNTCPLCKTEMTGFIPCHFVDTMVREVFKGDEDTLQDLDKRHEESLQAKKSDDLSAASPVGGKVSSRSTMPQHTSNSSMGAVVRTAATAAAARPTQTRILQATSSQGLPRLGRKPATPRTVLRARDSSTVTTSTTSTHFSTTTIAQTSTTSTTTSTNPLAVSKGNTRVNPLLPSPTTDRTKSVAADHFAHLCNILTSASASTSAARSEPARVHYVKPSPSKSPKGKTNKNEVIFKHLIQLSKLDQVKQGVTGSVPSSPVASDGSTAVIDLTEPK